MEVRSATLTFIMLHVVARPPSKLSVLRIRVSFLVSVENLGLWVYSKCRKFSTVVTLRGINWLEVTRKMM